MIDIEKGYNPTIAKLGEILLKYPDQTPAIAWITYFEYLMGTDNRTFLENFDFLSMDLDSTEVFLRLKKQKLGVGDFDLMIASVVIANDGVLVTSDEAFERITDLKLVLLQKAKKS